MSRVVLLVGIALAAGCGGGSGPAPVTQAEVPPPGPPLPPSTTPAAASAPAADLYQMDPAKHVIPNAPVAGRLQGQPFTPDRVELEGRQLTFRQGKDFFADLSITMFLDDKQVKSADEFKMTVSPSQKWTDGVPSLHVTAREGEKLPDTKFVNDDYAMTLEFGKADKGKVPGKIHLSLPDSQMSYLAGTFVAQRKRALDEPPGPEEVPFVQGTVQPPVTKGQQVWVGYVGLPDGGGDVISDGAAAAPLGDDGTSGGSRSLTFEPRAAGVRFEKFVPQFDFTRLPPGKYLVYARVKEGPAAWKWVDVAADGRATADLKLDPAAVGTAEVTVPADFQGQVRLAPADLGVPDPNATIAARVAFNLNIDAEPKDRKATIRNVPPGRYTIFLTPGEVKPRGTVEVAAGKTATAEVKAEAK